MDADSGPACSPLTTQQVDMMAAGTDPFRIKARHQVLRDAVEQAAASSTAEPSACRCADLTNKVNGAISHARRAYGFTSCSAKKLLDYLEALLENDLKVATKTPPLTPSIGDQFGGGIYAGLTEIDGKPARLILLDGEFNGVDWDAATKWAASIGGSLPTRAEQRLLLVNSKASFKENWYWSCEQRADLPTSAWGQYFSIGNQYSDFKSCREFARAVRRLPV